MHGNKRKSQQENGAAIVEAAICLPVIVMLLISVFVVGRALTFYMKLVRTSYEVARIASATPNLPLNDISNPQYNFVSACPPAGNPEIDTLCARLKSIDDQQHLGDYRGVMVVDSVPVPPGPTCRSNRIRLQLSSTLDLSYLFFTTWQLSTQVEAPYLFPDNC